MFKRIGHYKRKPNGNSTSKNAITIIKSSVVRFNSWLGIADRRTSDVKYNVEENIKNETRKTKERETQTKERSMG